MRKDNLVIGIVGGMGSYATLYFFKQILEHFPAEKEWERPRVIIDNYCTMPSRVRAILYGEKREEVIASLRDSIENLVKSGCTDVILACNTSHCFLNDVYKEKPYLENYVRDIIESCASSLQRTGVREAFLLASEGTIQTQIYDNRMNEKGIKIISPDEKEQIRIRKYIEAVKQNKIEKSDIEDFADYISEIKSDCIILGCTEIPVMWDMIKDRTFNKKVVNPLESVLDSL